MTSAVTAPLVATPTVGRTVAVALLMGLSIQAVGTLAWVGLIGLNTREYPEVPWAAVTMATVLVLMLVWLNGHGWPRRTSAFRRDHLRLWQPPPGAWSGESLTTILGLIGALAGLSGLYVLIAASRPPVDVTAYAVALRWSSLLMSPAVAGVVEEMAFRGYMQRHLERIGPTFAILVTSVVFTLLHAAQGLPYLLTLGPGIFLASTVYGYLALKSGSILPGMALHFAGDFGFFFFVLLGGDTSLLFVD